MSVTWAARLLGICAWLAAAAAAVAPAAAGGLDEDLYAALLLRHTREVPDLARTRVDYAGLTRSQDWKRLVAGIASSTPAALATREKRLAYWINVYNVLVIDLVVQHYPVEGIREIGSIFFPVWKREAGRAGGRPVTLDEIEHRILRPMGDPRIHTAIVCASLSCPALRREPFTASRLDAQLDGSVRRFLADRRKGLALDRDSGVVRLSRIFDWFSQDYDAEGGVLVFAARYAPAGDAEWLGANADGARIEHFDYDWSLNDLAGAPSGG